MPTIYVSRKNKINNDKKNRLKIVILGHTLLLNVFSALKGTHFYILFVVTATGVVLCGRPKYQPSTLPIVQLIFFFWSFETSGNILRNQKILFV